MPDEIKVTELELRILEKIWSFSEPVTVNTIIEYWSEAKKPGYTTILKTLQKMEAKDIVDHHKDGKQHAYYSKVSKENITQSRLGTIIQRVFSGNKISFAEYFIDANQFTKEELKELKKIITKKEKENKNDS